jgi:hypothetical protein
MIGESGEALVQRIPPVKENADGSAILGFRFQKGSIDELTFRGPNLGRLAALWIAPEAGQLVQLFCSEHIIRIHSTQT